MRRVVWIGLALLALSVGGGTAHAQERDDEDISPGAGAGLDGQGDGSDDGNGDSNGDRGPRVDPARLRDALARYAGEPRVDVAVRAALRVAAVDPHAAQSAASRARMSGWLPQLRVGARRGQGWDLSALTASNDAGHINLSTADDLSVEASVTFYLPRIVYAREEATLLREARARQHARASLVRTVVGLYFERRRLQLERDLMGRTDLSHQMRIGEIEALLDAFTGGAFGRMLRRGR